MLTPEFSTLSYKIFANDEVKSLEIMWVGEKKSTRTRQKFEKLTLFLIQPVVSLSCRADVKK